MATITTTYGFTGAGQSFNVPNGVPQVSVDVSGASSGASQGGRVTGIISGLSGSSSLYLVCGEGGNGGVGGGSGSKTNAGGAAAYGSGGAGGAGYNDSGGSSGAGYSAIRLNGGDGSIRCVAGGAGGKSGDGGAGGEGGGSTGDTGSRGNAGSGAATGGTGGSQSSGGNGGTSSSGSSFNGNNASDTTVARGGTGGDTGGLNGPGGGGGGGGVKSGGGGAAGSTGYAPGTGGGGGSNYTGGLSSAGSSASYRTGNGTITISYTVPNPAVPVITNPGVGERMKANSITFTANTSDPNNKSTYVQFRYDTDPAFGSYNAVNSNARSSPGAVSATVSGLLSNSRYYVRAYSYQDVDNVYSASYDTSNFYTNYAPNVPGSVSPPAGTQVNTNSTMTVSALLTDPDGGNASGQVRLLVRYSTGSGFAAGTYTDIFSGYVANGVRAIVNLNGLSPDTHYYVRFYANDGLLYSTTFVSYDFYTNSTPSSPTLNDPTPGETIFSGELNVFSWDFNDPGDISSSFDFQYREVGTSDWTVYSPSASTNDTQWAIPPDTLGQGKTYEWQVRTYDQAGLVSLWSPSQLFSTLKELRDGIVETFRPGVSRFPKRGLGL